VLAVLNMTAPPRESTCLALDARQTHAVVDDEVIAVFSPNGTVIA
jgi:hypothetical protein